jgi:hypothetical protein
MFPIASIAFASNVLVAAAGDIPTIDLNAVCKKTQSTITALFGNSAVNVFETCMSDEQNARDQLGKDWSSYPAPDKTLCLKPRDYMPSYVEWLVCLELRRDVRKGGNEPPAPLTPEPSRRRR